MKTWVRRTARVGILSAGFLLVAGTAAAANASPLDTPQAPMSANAANSGQTSVDNKGIANGTQVSIPIQVPVNLCGNGVGVLGAGIGVSGSCDNGALLGSGAAAESAHTTEAAHSTEDAAANDGQTSAGNMGILNGTQVSVPIQVPVNLCGNGVGVLGAGIGVSGACSDGAVNGSGASAESAHTTEDANVAQGGGAQTSAGNAGILNGTQVSAPIQVPINACGNGVGVLGLGLGISGSCDNGALIGSDTNAGGGTGPSYPSDQQANAVKPATTHKAHKSQNTLVSQGNQVTKHAHKAKANKAKESATEDMWSQPDASGPAMNAANDGQTSAGNQGILNGTQVSAPIQVPVNVCGNGVGVLGVGIGVSGSCDNGAANLSGASTGGGMGTMADRNDH